MRESLNHIDQTQFTSGDTFHCWRESFLSRLIRKVTGSSFSHTAVFIRVNGLSFIVEAQADGVRLVPFHYWVNKYNYDFIATRNFNVLSSNEEYFKAAAKYVGYKYGFFDLVRHWIYRKTGKRLWLGIDKEHKRLICSELRMLIHDHFYNVIEDVEKMSPKEVYEWEMDRGFRAFFERNN